MPSSVETLADMPNDETLALGLRPGTYARGTETVDAILKAAHDVLIEEGASAFTIRRIATASGMKVGNVSYHFPRKEMLIKIMLDELLESYDKLLESEVRKPGVSPEERLRLMIVLCLDDIAGSAPRACSPNCGRWPITTPSSRTGSGRSIRRCRISLARRWRRSIRRSRPSRSTPSRYTSAHLWKAPPRFWASKSLGPTRCHSSLRLLPMHWSCLPSRSSRSRVRPRHKIATRSSGRMAHRERDLH